MMASSMRTKGALSDGDGPRGTPGAPPDATTGVVACSPGGCPFLEASVWVHGMSDSVCAFGAIS